MTLAERGVQVLTAAPVQLKKFITGRHSAEKEDVINAVNARFNLTFSTSDNDLADAAALAAIGLGCLDPSKLTLRHEAEVVAAVTRTIKNKKRPGGRRPRRRLVSV